jgi:hypothetical protein
MIIFQICVYSQSFHDQNTGSITRLVSKREMLSLLARRQANVIPFPFLLDTSFCVGSAKGESRSVLSQTKDNSWISSCAYLKLSSRAHTSVVC